MTPFLAKDDFASGQGKGELSPTPDDLTSNPDPFAVPDVSTDPTPALFASKKVSPEAASSAPPAPTETTKPVSSQPSKNSDKDLLKQHMPSSLKSPTRGRGSGFCKQEILFLSKAYIRASPDPIVGTSQTEDTFYGKVGEIYNQLVALWKEENEDGECFSPFTFSTKYSLRSHVRRCLQSALQKFAGIESRYKIKSGENEDTHFGRLLAIYEEETKNSKVGIPKEFSKYLEAYIWLKDEPKFGTNILNLAEAVEENILMSNDVSVFRIETDVMKQK